MDVERWARCAGRVRRLPVSCTTRMRARHVYFAVATERRNCNACASVEWLKQHGWAARALLFVAVEDSDENRLIIATRQWQCRQSAANA